jgi:hypothetical protein
MRRLLVLGLILFLGALGALIGRAGRPLVAPGLPSLRGTPASTTVEPIPQDHARMEQQFRERLEWNRRTLGVAYDKIGKKDPRWDEPAREALDLAARMFSLQSEPIIRFPNIHAAARRAVDAGCHDPLILYLYARTSVGQDDPGSPEYARRLEAAAVALAASDYSPFRRAVAMRAAIEPKVGDPKLTPAAGRELQTELDAVIDLLPKSAAEDARTDDWENLWFTEINSVIGLHKQLSGDYKAAYDRVDDKLAKTPGIEALRLAVKGNFHIMWGWEARTTAFAPAVGESQFRAFEKRLVEASNALQAAWKLKPGEPNVARLMIEVEKGIGGGERQAMETWFERAMTSDGNDYQACLTKLDWLDPKWHGGDTPDEMLAFGHACAATKNWHTGITLLAGDAHLRVCSALQGPERLKYMRSPEVWNEIRTVYDEYLRHYPEDDGSRSKYAMLCFLGAHHAKAHAQFQAVGDRLTPWTTFPFYPLETMKKAREFSAKVVAGNVPQGAAPIRRGQVEQKK